MIVLMMTLYKNVGHSGCDLHVLKRQSFSSPDFRNISNSHVHVANSCNQNWGGQHICGVICVKVKVISPKITKRKKRQTLYAPTALHANFIWLKINCLLNTVLKLYLIKLQSKRLDKIPHRELRAWQILSHMISLWIQYLNILSQMSS